MPLAPDRFEQELWAIKSQFGDLNANSFYARFFEGRVDVKELRFGFSLSAPLKEQHVMERSD